MFGSLKNLGLGLVETAKNSVNFAQQKTAILKAYYELGGKIVEEYKNDTLKLSDELKADVENLIKMIEEADMDLVDESVLSSINEIKNGSTKEETSKEETPKEETPKEEAPKEEVKKETPKKAPKKAAKKDEK